MNFQERSVCLALEQNPVRPLVNCSSFLPFPLVSDVIKTEDEFIGRIRVLLRIIAPTSTTFTSFGVKYIRCILDISEGCGLWIGSRMVVRLNNVDSIRDCTRSNNNL